jgi:hypothetical protein
VVAPELPVLMGGGVVELGAAEPGAGGAALGAGVPVEAGGVPVDAGGALLGGGGTSGGSTGVHPCAAFASTHGNNAAASMAGWSAGLRIMQKMVRVV